MDIDQIRNLRVKKLLDYMKKNKLKVTPYISQLKNDSSKPFGMRAAMNMEKTLNLPTGFLTSVSDCSISDSLGETLEEKSINYFFGNSHRRVPSYEVRMKDGKLDFTLLPDEKSVIVLRKFLPSNGKLYALQLEDNSLAPELNSGDMIVIDCSDDSTENVRDGYPYTIWLQGRLFTRRINNTINGMILKSDNPMIEDIIVTSKDLENRNCVVVGRVVWRGGRIA